MKFRKKPVVIQAVQWTGFNLGEIREFMEPNYPLVPNIHELKKPKILIIKTLEGDHTAQVEDWIIRGVAGEFYPCKPDIFDKTYEPIK